MPKTKAYRTKTTVSSKGTSAQAPLAMLEETLNTYFGKKAPALPKGVKEFLVSIAPWLTLIAVVFMVPALLAVFSMVFMRGTWSQYYGYGMPNVTPIIVAGIFAFTMLVLDVLALPGLFKRRKDGWNYMFYGSLVGVVSNIVSFNIFGLVVGTLLSMYFLFQLRSYYK